MANKLTHSFLTQHQSTTLETPFIVTWHALTLSSVELDSQKTALVTCRETPEFPDDIAVLVCACLFTGKHGNQDQMWLQTTVV